MFIELTNADGKRKGQRELFNTRTIRKIEPDQVLDGSILMLDGQGENAGRQFMIAVKEKCEDIGEALLRAGDLAMTRR